MPTRPLLCTIAAAVPTTDDFAAAESVQQKHNAERQSESKSPEDADKIMGLFISLGNHGLQCHGQNASSGKGSRHRFEQIRR